jgi:biopolymer transport protein ExbD
VRIGNASGDFERVDLMMMPMIDICFQLLIFFVANMRILSPEGSFSVEMPAAAAQAGPSNSNDESQLPPIRVRIAANKSGDMAGIRIGRRVIPSFEDLRKEVQKICNAERGPAAAGMTPEVEFECDYNLRYENVIEAVTAVTGYLADNDQTVVRLVEKIRFIPTAKPQDPSTSGSAKTTETRVIGPKGEVKTGKPKK